jgi:hypothetical protein
MEIMRFSLSLQVSRGMNYSYGPTSAFAYLKWRHGKPTYFYLRALLRHKSCHNSFFYFIKENAKIMLVILV